MSILLLLSALLSALTGAGAPVRFAQPTAAVQVAAVAAVAVVPGVIRADRPIVSLPQPGAMRVEALPVWRLAAPSPLYLSRRRE